MTEMQTAEPELQRPSPGALRVRRLRERRQQGEVWVSCVLRRNFVEALVAFGWLHADQQGNHIAVGKAFRGFAARALAVARSGGPHHRYFR
jgi:hypothetical protein